MTIETPEYAAILERLTRVEQENRKLKRAGLAILLVIAAFILTAQVLPTKVVEANEFVLKDASGKVRARLWFGVQPTSSPSMTMFDFYDAEGKELAYLGTDSSSHDANLKLGGEEGQGSVWLGATGQGAGISLKTSGNPRDGIGLSAYPGASSVFLDGKMSWLTLEDTANASKTIRPWNGQEGPYVDATDAEGFETSLGASETVSKQTGVHHTSSAASLKMFDKSGNVIWSAP